MTETDEMVEFFDQWPEVPGPCECHTSFAYITNRHPGHCCFWPESQTCHPAEVAAWEAERDRRNRREAS